MIWLVLNIRDLVVDLDISLFAHMFRGGRLFSKGGHPSSSANWWLRLKNVKKSWRHMKTVATWFQARDLWYRGLKIRFVNFIVAVYFCSYRFIGKLIRQKIMSTYSVFWKTGREIDRFTGKLIQSSIGEFWGVTRAVLLENSSRPFFKAFVNF